jgi:hypothetical protein
VSDLVTSQRRIAALCLAAEVDEAALASLGGDPRRWRVYRDLVRNRLWALCLEGLPRAFAAAGVERFGGWFTRFLEADPPRTHFARDVAPALGAWALRDEGDALEPWLAEALAHDLAEHHVGLTNARPDASRVTDFAMHLPAALDPAHRRLRLRWERVDDAWVERPRALLLHRHATQHTVETLALTPMAADVLDAMDDGVTPAAEAVRAVLSRHDVVAGAVFVESFAGLLAELMERGVLAGSLRGE